jgi:hypothetical protein
MTHKVKFVPSGRGKAQCPPDPNYPHGIAIGLNLTVPTCKIDLPYPAPECGWFEIDCDVCNARLLVTAAGRPDDPISVRVPCQIGAFAEA